MRVYLLGFMGSGKSTLGKKLASKMGLGFIDLDKALEKRLGESIEDIFNLKGEAQFRSEETRQLHLTSQKANVVIALGGGTPCQGENMKLIRSSGISVYLKLGEATLYNRLSKNRGNRPLLLSLNDKELEAYVSKTLSEREVYYDQADVTFDALSLSAERFEELIKQIEGYSK